MKTPSECEFKNEILDNILYFYIKIIFSLPSVGQASLGANNLRICQLT